MRKQPRIELLAPAGDVNAFYGAISAGADAVYLAGERFGARAYAENFTEEKLIECIRYGHLFGRKIYLTVNTLFKEEDISSLYGFLKPLYEANLDAVIVQDAGVLRFIRDNFPGLELHGSTQISLCTEYGAALMKSMGVSRIVPARELSLNEIKEIKNHVDIELETFIHGAMCYCYSGQCLFSSILGGRSGNRGRCAQPCRLPFTVKEAANAVNKGIGEKINIPEKEKYYLSMKDMCTIEHIPALINAGISSFKIEGRMKKPEYTAGVTSIYRKYIDLYYALLEKHGAKEAEKKYCVDPKDLQKLSTLYIRSETQDGYYFRQNGKEMITLSNPGYSGSDNDLLENIRQNYLNRKLKHVVDMQACFHQGKPVTLKLTCNHVSVTVSGNNAQTALKQPITEDNIRNQITKLGDGPFTAGKVIIEMSDNIFYPLKEINELRRQAVSALENAIIENANSENENFENKNTGDLSLEDTDFNIRILEELSKKEETSVNVSFSEKHRENPGDWMISVSTSEQLQGLARWYQKYPSETKPRYVYLPGDLALEMPEIIREAERNLKGSFFMLSLPYIFRQRDKRYLDELISLVEKGNTFHGFLVRSADELGYLRERKAACLIHTDANLYVWNSEALKEICQWSEMLCLPYELRAFEQRQLLKSDVSFAKVCYGRIPMMISANCVLRTVAHCDKKENRSIILEDRYGKGFPVVRDCRHCTNIIYNSVPLFLHSEISKWKGMVSLRLDFTTETCLEVNQILNAFIAGGNFKPSEYTTGHEKRGVE
ncbi:MAG: U32 family peptidase [Acetatifactor sp.]